MTNVEVVIDAGHGAHDSGAVGSGLLEKERALKLSHMLNEELRSSGVSTYMTRTTDVFVTLSGRAKMANDRGAKVFISNHLNSGGGTGYESFIYNRNDSNTNRLQDLIHAEAMKVLAPLGFRDRGKKTANLAVVRETRMPAVLTENGFIDNDTDMAQIRKDEVLRKLAQAYAKAICEYLGKSYKGNSNTTPPPTGNTASGDPNDVFNPAPIGVLKNRGTNVNVRKGTRSSVGTNSPIVKKIGNVDLVAWDYRTGDGWVDTGNGAWVKLAEWNSFDMKDVPVMFLYCQGDGVNVRRAPSTSGAIDHKMSRGTRIQVRGRRGDWLYLGWGNWVYFDSSYLEVRPN